MRVEDGYLITETNEEARRIFNTSLSGDQYRFIKTSAHWSDAGLGVYTPGEGCEIRRRLSACTKEVLARAGVVENNEMAHFL